MLNLNFQAPASCSLPIFFSLCTPPIITLESQLALPQCFFPGFPFFWLLEDLAQFSLFPDLLLLPQFLGAGNTICSLVTLLFQVYFLSNFPYISLFLLHFYRLISDFFKHISLLLFFLPPCFCLPLFLADGMLRGIPALPVACPSFSPKTLFQAHFSAAYPRIPAKTGIFPSDCSYLLLPSWSFPPHFSSLNFSLPWNYLWVPSQLLHPQ